MPCHSALCPRIAGVLMLLLPLTTGAALLPLDSRRWAQHETAQIVADFSPGQPATALTKGRREQGKWKLLPFATAAMEGWALSAYGSTRPSPVSVALPASGWHAVYLGLATVPGGVKETRSGLQARLSDESVFRHLACNVPQEPERRDVIHEQFLTVARLDGQTLEIAPLPGLPATLCYVKLVPLTAEELAAWSEQRASGERATRTAIATFDGHGWIWPYEPRSAADLLANFRGFEDSDVGKWWFQVVGADIVCYPSKVGTIPGEDAVDFSSAGHASYTRSLKELFRAGVHPLQVARDAARAQGAEFHVMLRPAGWMGAMPFEETLRSRFYEAHPEWRCVDRDGTPTMYLSYAVPEVRQQTLAILRETLELRPEGVGLLFNRGMPMILWEEAFCGRFRDRHAEDPRTLPEDDPRILDLRADFMTEYLQEIRLLLDETARAQSRTEPYRISVAAFSRASDNRKFGLSLPEWIERGLVDEIAVAWFAHHTSFTPPDMAYYRRLTAGTKVGVYPFVISWSPGKPMELCAKVRGYYEEGARGLAIWDPQVEAGWRDGSPGNVFEVLGRLGHREQIEEWAAMGVPVPLTIPLKRLGDNFYSRWIPTTGF